MSSKNGFHVSIATGSTKSPHFVVQSLPVAGQHMGTRNNNIDLAGSRLDGSLNLSQFLLHGVLAGGKTRRDGGNGNTRAAQGLNSYRHKIMIDTNGSNLQIKTTYTHCR